MEPADRRLHGHAGDPRLGRASCRRASLGRLQEIGWARPPFFVYRGRADASGRRPRGGDHPRDSVSTRWRTRPRAAAPPTTPRGCRSPTVRCDWAAARHRGIPWRRSPPLPPAPAVPPSPPRRGARRRRDHRSHPARRYGLPEHGQGRDAGVRRPAPQLRLRSSGVDRLGLLGPLASAPRDSPGPGPRSVDRGPRRCARRSPPRARLGDRARRRAHLPARRPQRHPRVRGPPRELHLRDEGRRHGRAPRETSRRWRAASASFEPGSPKARRGSRCASSEPILVTAPR